MKRQQIGLTVNGRRYSGEAPPRMTLVDFLREELRLTGTHVGCEHGICGACSVLFDGDAVRSCLMFAVQAAGHVITTVEGLTGANGELGVLQDCFWEAHAMQCGYCTPGMMIAGHALLQSNADPSDDEIRDAIGGNLCRCTGYVQIVEAIRLAAQRLTESLGDE